MKVCIHDFHKYGESYEQSKHTFIISGCGWSEGHVSFLNFLLYQAVNAWVEP